MTLTAVEAEQRKLQDMDNDQLVVALRNREDALQTATMAATVAADRRNEAVLELAARDFRNSQIAAILGCSHTRVKQIIVRAQLSGAEGRAA